MLPLLLALALLVPRAFCQLTDNGDFSHAANHANMQLASNQLPNGTQIDTGRVFKGDDARYSRSTQQKGALKYEVANGIKQAIINFWAYQASANLGTWKFSVLLADNAIVDLTSAGVESAVAAAAVRACGSTT
jgi:hypothetical protein